MMQDLVPSLVDLMLSQLLMSKYSAGGAFKVVEVELGLIYDMLYTKAPLIYSRVGIILRSISFLLTFTAFITFQVNIEKHAYSTIDFTITYLLFVAAIFLEFYAFLCLVFSDWTMIWLTDEGGNALTSALYSLIRKLTRSERWSRSIAQYNLISSSIESKPPKCLEFLGIDEMMRQMNVNRKDMNGGLQDFIFGHLQKNSLKIKEDFNFIDKNFRRKIIGQRGDGVLEREGLLQDLKWSTTEVEFSRSILVWHLATEICYCVDKDANNAPQSMKQADAYLNT
jgi:protein-S-isoprenylcysteine O-methyltransferase Ste14